MVIRMHK
jgi:hypothetical protein